MSTTLDFRPRCEYCNKIPRGRMALENYRRYAPFCSFDHQERGKLRDAMHHLARIKVGDKP